MHRKLTRLLCVVALATAAAACGESEEPPGAAETGEPPAREATTTSAAETTSTTTDDGIADAIVSLSPPATEMLFAIGAGDQVIAVDVDSDFPADVPTSDLNAFEPNVEAIAELDPDLVVLAADVDDVVAGLEALGIEVLFQPPAETLEDTFDQITELGEVTGHEEEAADLNEQIQSDIDELVASLPDRDEVLTYYWELDPTLFSATNETFVGDLLRRAGLTSIADLADPDNTSGGFPQLSAELIVQADPDLIFLADSDFGESAETVAARPGFAGLTAVTEGRIVPLDADIASRWGPRVVDLLELVIDAVAAVPVA